MEDLYKGNLVYLTQEEAGPGGADLPSDGLPRLPPRGISGSRDELIASGGVVTNDELAYKQYTEGKYLILNTEKKICPNNILKIVYG